MTGESRADAPRHRWTFLSNHAHVLVCLDEDSDATMQQVADRIGITLRAVQAIVVDLTADGYLRVERRGRRNHYTLDGSRPLRHPLEEHATARQLLDAVATSPPAPPTAGTH